MNISQSPVSPEKRRIINIIGYPGDLSSYANFLLTATTNLVWFGDGAQNKSGKIDDKGDILTMHQLRQMWVITLLSNY